jgi:hypothetical protein
MPRLQAGGQPTSIIEIPLTAGVTTNANGYEIGAGLRQATNLLPRSYRLTDELRRRSFSYVPLPTGRPGPLALPGPEVEYGGDRVLGVAFYPQTALANTYGGIVVTVDDTTGHLLFWKRAPGGAGILDTGIDIGVGKRLSAAAVTTLEATPTVGLTTELGATLLSHPYLLNQTYIADRAGSIGAYTPAVNPGDASLYKGNTAIIWHLDRMWFAKTEDVQLGLGNGFRTRIWYTDPLDLNTIRPTSFVAISDRVTSMFRCSASSVDLGAAAHLVFGALQSIWALDGDPTLGNAVLRRLVTGCGVADSALVAETPLGAMLLATDGQFYLIAPGATELRPFGTPIRDRAQGFSYSEYGAAFTAPSPRGPASVAWVSPYLYYSPRYLSEVWVCDWSDPTTPRWWGPSDAQGVTGSPVHLFTVPPEAGATISRAGGGVALADYPSDQSLWIGAERDATHAASCYHLRLSVENAVLRQQLFETGYLQVPDHRIELQRVVVETINHATGYNLAVAAILPDTTSQSLIRQPTTTFTATRDHTTKTVYAMASRPVVADWVMLRISAAAGQNLDLLRAYAEVRVQPRQD